MVATHGTPFLGLPSDDNAGPLYVYVRREGDGVACEPFAASHLHALDEIVAALGFDRGELLTTVSMFLVVEGIHDVVLLKEAFPELRAARIALLAMSGVSNFRAVIEADALWRYTTAHVALATDKFDEETLRRLAANPEEARKLRKSSAPEETKLLGTLIGLAHMSGKTIHLLGHTGTDLIDVIDEDIVSAEFPDYPGHEEAARRWQEQILNGAKARDKKPFYEREFGLPMDVDSYIKLGQALAREHRRPEALKQIVDDAIRIATGQRARNAVTVTPPAQSEQADTEDASGASGEGTQE